MLKPVFVCLATDDNYAPLAAVSIVSLLENNKDANELEIFLLDSGISEKNKKKLQRIVNNYSRKITFLDVTQEIIELQNKGVKAQGSYQSFAAYARFFAIDKLPTYVDKLLYIDCDTCICESLQELFNIELYNCVIGAVIDILPDFHKKAIGFKDLDLYFNSGVILFDCYKWREENILEQIQSHLCNVRSKYSFHDQDIINIICKDKIYPLKPKYMAFLPEYTWGKSGIIQLTNLQESAYYEEKYINEAVNNPVIIHYVDNILGRPWYKNNINIYGSIWEEYFAMSSFKNEFNYIERNISIGHQLLRILYKILPKKYFISIHKYRKNKVLKNKEESIQNIVS